MASLWSSNLRDGFADSSRRFSKSRKPAERIAARNKSSGAKLYVHLFRNDGGKAHLRGEDDVVPLIVHSWSQLLNTATKRLSLAWAGKRVFAKHDGSELFSIEDLKQLNEQHHGAEVVVSVGEAFKSATLHVRRCKSKFGHAGGARAIKAAKTPRTPRELWHSALEPAHDAPLREVEHVYEPERLWIAHESNSEQPWSPEFADEGEDFQEEDIQTLQNTRSQLYTTLMQSRRAVRHDNFI